MDSLINIQKYEEYDKGKKKQWALNCEKQLEEHPEW